MSLRHDFDRECRRLAPLFAAAQNADRDLHAAWKEGVSLFGGHHHYKQTEQYQKTFDRFNESRQVIDQIIGTALSEAKAGKVNLATLFAYTALPGRYYRSGYQRASIWRFLKHLTLEAEQVQILRGIVLDQITRAGPEFVEICRAARNIDSAELRESVRKLLLQPQKPYVLDRAKRMLDLLEHTSV